MLADEELLLRFGRSPEELTGLAEAHTQDVQAWLSSRSPGAENFSGKGLHASSTAVSFLQASLIVETSTDYKEVIEKAEIEFKRLRFTLDMMIAPDEGTVFQ